MPSSHSSNYCAYCGGWALEQQEGFCIPCCDDFKTKTKAVTPPSHPESPPESSGQREQPLA